MTRDEMDRAAEWLRDRAQWLERNEPHATNTITACRDAADELDAAHAEDH